MIERLRSEFFIFMLALQFLTRLPISVTNEFTSERMTASVRYYPLVGLLIGAIAATTFAVSLIVFPTVIAVLISTSLGILLTGAFHEDGLADTFDGIGGGSSSTASLEIMKDSRIGVYGMLALTLALALKIAGLSAMPSATCVVALLSAHAISRWSSVVVIATSTYVRDDGTGKPTAEGIGMPSFMFATLPVILATAVLYCYTSPLEAAGALIGLALAHILIRLYFERKIGGYTGDCLGAAQQASELGLYLGILACQ
jgi:adenosylcobinamide-GDP ribazoletransferase